MTEFEETVALANRILERPNADPDDDEAMLARQFLRALERDTIRRDVLIDFFRWQQTLKELMPDSLGEAVYRALGEETIKALSK